jgi:uncharacterized protein (TIGR02001 family)
MKKLALSVFFAAAFAAPPTAFGQAAAPAAAPTPEHSFTGNLTLGSDYRFRGISQTYKLPTVQGGFDYAHSSGVYLGTWMSNVSGNQYANGAGLEWDMYGGYKGNFTDDLGYDVGMLYYYYPGAHYPNPPKNTKYDNLELYGALTYKWFVLKYSHTLSDFFGTNNDTFGGACAGGDCFALTPGNSKGSGYLDLTYTYEVADKLNLIAHVGHQSVRHYGKLDYTDYKLGVTKEINGFTFGAAIIGTNAKKAWYTVTELGGAGNKVVSKDTLVFTVGKTF